ncbi:MAG: DinB family protein [Acidobacteria bacterium]|nr:DinB family protein [Acidobacteriota bacterium]MBI3425869.1 DinB family protein [Acidobacteriota bacterium]
MNHPQTLIAALAGAPEIIIGLVREVLPQNLKRRPSPNKWSVHEHACHITTIDTLYLARLELMLSETSPQITPMSASPEEEAGALLNVALNEALALYVRERTRLVERLQQLAEADWLRTAAHEEYSHYSVWIMFRQLLLHEMQHAYRIEELRLKKDWA